MAFFKKFRKRVKRTFLFNIFQNIFFIPLKSYSDTFGEDLFINNYFSEKGKGIYVDVGCNQPKINSLTYSLYKKGWVGVNFDISERCIQLYNFFRKNDKNFNYSVGNNKKWVKSFIFYENCTMNTVDESFKKYTTHSVNKKPEIKKVMQVTLDQVLLDNNISRIDYLNIDVEGYEKNVLEGFSIKKFRPSLISIEIHDQKCPPIQNKIYKYFVKNNYRLVSIYGWTYFFEFETNKKIHFKI